jgi:hypothetical protein
MFKKAFHVKARSPLRQSDKKKLRTRLLASHPILNDDAFTHLLSLLPPHLNDQSPPAYRSVDVEHAKIVCFNDVITNLYFFAGVPLFFGDDDRLLPSGTCSSFTK